MLSEREKAARCAQFDSYCHTILHNVIRKCRICEKACKMEIKPYLNLNSPECIRCG